MGGIAAVLVGLGIVVGIYALMQKSKAARVSKAPFAKTGDAAQKGGAAAGEKGAISVEGNVACAAPLTSPCSGTPCLYYELKVVGEWKEGSNNKSDDLVNEKKAAAFTLDDGSGPVAVDANKGGDLEPLEKTFGETKKQGLLADLKNIVGKGKPMEFGKYAFTPAALTKADKFTVTEKVMKVPPKLFALGMLENGQIVSPSWRSLILTPKSREEVVGSATKSAKMAFIGSGSMAGLGLILGVISMFVGGGKPAAKELPSDEVVVAAKDGAAAAKDDAAAAAKEDAPAAEPAAKEQAPAVDDTCAKAAKCCDILNAKKKGKSPCDGLRGPNMPAAACQGAYASYKKALKATKNKHAAECP